LPVADSIEREATMSGKRRHYEREVEREALMQQAKLDAVAHGVAVDPRALSSHNSYSPPDFLERGYYVDKPFVCQACGISQMMLRRAPIRNWPLPYDCPSANPQPSV
jgi:hypothetical protein